MRKITTSAVVLAALFMSGYARDPFTGRHALDTTNGFHQTWGCRDCEAQLRRNDHVIQDITQATAEALDEATEQQRDFDQGQEVQEILFPGDETEPYPIRTKLN